MRFNLKLKVMNKKQYLVIIISFFFFSVLASNPQIQVAKIWDNAPHNAFTDLIRYNNKFYCTFREGTGHIPVETGDDGKIRILISDDGVKWESLALLKKKDYDLRDSKLSVTPDGRLMVLIGGSNYDGHKLINRLGHVSFLDKYGKHFSEPKPIKIDKKIQSNYNWLWRVTWFKNTGYGVIYRKKDKIKSEVFLVKTRNGIDYSLVSALNIDGLPGESTVLINPDEEMMILMRRDGGDKHGFIGSARPPYTQWKWEDIGLPLGGPNIIPFNDTTYIMGTRSFQEGEARTALFFTEKSGSPYQFLELPSGGDTSYPGMLMYNDTLWVSYYSSHEGKSKIYMAKIPLSYINKLLSSQSINNTGKY